MNTLNVVKELGSNKNNNLSSTDTLIFPIKYVEDGLDDYRTLFDIDELEADINSRPAQTVKVDLPRYIKQGEWTDVSELRYSTAFTEVVEIYDLSRNYDIHYEIKGKWVKISSVSTIQEEAGAEGWVAPITPEDPYIYLVVHTSSWDPK